ncbi:hypothetical protein MVES1_001073 [Malassezia vespertilionis]|uniref:GATA-type domain-containing protein n=1 Tax=Malassezia vespertilionis TaxID=2020962 RepID=A0A2N1JEM4_9BASI|nr:uncharacterized protein MVES1_001073 [Malassezia vespertilionis]PKI85002.1 hypothetical protein MVES_001012 [Malassezia vespertilionis]WFD05740.1 hypothetical protein MVES1_001073 [Malassezia vespertilionis]
MRFIHLDPAVQLQLGEAAHGLLDHKFIHFVHKDERAHVQDDLQKIVASQTLFGSVIRCRIADLDTMRVMLEGGMDVPPKKAQYTNKDIVANMIGKGLMLCFFHTIPSSNAADEEHEQACGNLNSDFTQPQARALWDCMHRIKHHDSTKLDYVFQVLSNTSPRTILFSWPPPRTETRGHDGGVEDDTAYFYFAEDFARLIQGMQAGNGGRLTSCTQRFKASHTLTAAGRVRSIASVVIPYGALVFACYKVGSDNVQVGHVPQKRTALQRDAPAVNPVHPQTPHIPTNTNNTGWAPESQATGPIRSGTEQAHKPSMPALNSTEPMDKNALFAANGASTKACLSCGKTDSPEWRRGPTGHKTLCNACGLRYARSLSNKRKKSKDGSVVTMEPFGDPNMVPPSRGSGGGSRPGVHRRTSSKRSLPREQVPLPEPAPSQASRSANALQPTEHAHMPQETPHESTIIPSFPHAVMIAAAAAAAAHSGAGTPANVPAIISDTMPANTLTDTDRYMANAAAAAAAATVASQGPKELNMLLPHAHMEKSAQAPLFTVFANSIPKTPDLPKSEPDLAGPTGSLPRDAAENYEMENLLHPGMLP